MKISKGNQPLLSIVIPCYNEEDVLNETISQLDMFCNKIQDSDIELIFVDDGSKDQTRTILKKYSSRNNKVREGANKQVISSQADSLIKISRIWADFFPANTSNQPI
ncbi:glycosyltransferase [Escherichia coli]|nr:glycosyltransferase [Escherichia coli]